MQQAVEYLCSKHDAPSTKLSTANHLNKTLKNTVFPSKFTETKQRGSFLPFLLKILSEIYDSAVKKIKK
jgi:hypothetical protein